MKENLKKTCPMWHKQPTCIMKMIAFHSLSYMFGNHMYCYEHSAGILYKLFF